MAVYSIKHDNITYDLVVVFRVTSTSVIESCNDIASIIENNVVNLKGELIMIGNFNITMDKLEDPDTITFHRLSQWTRLTESCEFHHSPVDLALHRPSNHKRNFELYCRG